MGFQQTDTQMKITKNLNVIKLYWGQDIIVIYFCRLCGIHIFQSNNK